jgi:hypothetical protein
MRSFEVSISVIKLIILVTILTFSACAGRWSVDSYQEVKSLSTTTGPTESKSQAVCSLAISGKSVDLSGIIFRGHSMVFQFDPTCSSLLIKSSATSSVSESKITVKFDKSQLLFESEQLKLGPETLEDLELEVDQNKQLILANEKFRFIQSDKDKKISPSTFKEILAEGDKRYCHFTCGTQYLILIKQDGTKMHYLQLHSTGRVGVLSFEISLNGPNEILISSAGSFLLVYPKARVTDDDLLLFGSDQGNRDWLYTERNCDSVNTIEIIKKSKL